MENKGSNFFKDTKEDLADYVNDRLWLFKLEAGEKFSKLTAAIIVWSMVGAVFSMLLLFIGFMLAHFFAEQYHSVFEGFKMVVLIYTGLFILLLLFSKWIIAGIRNLLIKIIFAPKKDADEK